MNRTPVVLLTNNFIRFSITNDKKQSYMHYSSKNILQITQRRGHFNSVQNVITVEFDLRLRYGHITHLMK